MGQEGNGREGGGHWSPVPAHFLANCRFLAPSFPNKLCTLLPLNSLGFLPPPFPAPINLFRSKMKQVAAKMQRRLSCTADPIEEQHQFSAGATASSPSRALSQHARLRRTSAQESIDSAFSVLMGNRRKGSADSNVGQIQPDLYRRRGSVISIGSNGTSGVLGRLQLQLTYDHSRSDLLVRLVQATLNCPVPPQLGGCCRIRLSIQGQPLVKCRESEAIAFGEEGQWKAAENGDANQQFKLPLGYSELGDAMLLVELMAAEKGGGQDSPSRHALCSVPLGSLGPSADDLTVWADLERISETGARGELLLCLQYLPAAERLTLSVHQAANLRLSNLGRGGIPTDLFIRAQLVGPEEKVLKRRKSGTRKAVSGDSVVVWDEVIGFDKVDPFSLPRCHLDLQLIGSDRFGRAERALGQIIFGPNKFGGGTRLWPPDVGRWNVPRWIPLDPIEGPSNASEGI